MALFAYGPKLAEKVAETALSSTVRPMDEVDEIFHNCNEAFTTEHEIECVSSDGESTNDGEFGDKNATSYMGMLSSLLWNAPVERKPSYISGIDSWVPSKPEQIIEVPEGMIASYKRVYPLMGDDLCKNGAFAVISDASVQVDFNASSSSTESSATASPASTRTSSPIPEIPIESLNLETGEVLNIPPPPLIENHKPPLYHLIITFWKGSQQNKHVLSLYRSRRVTDVIALCERCRECKDLFKVNPKNMKKEEYLTDLLIVLKKNILWKSCHIAAAMGIIEYFKPGNRSSKQSLHLFCHPESMTPLLIAVRYNRIEMVSHLLTLSPDITVVDVNKNNVLHLAASASDVMVKILMETGKCADLLNVPNIHGCSPLYLAVTTANMNAAKTFRAYGASFTAVPAAISQNPLMDLMKKNKLDLVQMRKILEANPEALNEKDPLTGNGVLHNAMYKKPLIALLQLKLKEIHLESRNSQMQTPFHIYVQRSDLSLVMALAAFGADVNAKDNNGNTPLHLAVSNINLEIVRFLLCMGAEPNVINNHYETPRHLAAKMVNDETGREIIKSLIICGARACDKGFAGCTVACVHKDNFVPEPKPKLPANSSSGSLKSLKKVQNGQEEDEISMTSVDPQAPTAMYEFELDPDSHELDPAYKEPNPIRSFPQEGAIKNMLEKLKKIAEGKKESNIISILSLDGGGIKGLVIVQLLLALQKYLDQPLVNYFDWIAGTSTGSYVSGALTTGTSLRTMQKMYLRFKDALFDSWSRPYSAETLETFLREMFGEETRLSDVKYPKLFFTTVRADTFPVQMELLRNYRLPVTVEENEELGFTDPHKLELWRAARRSSAAPTYFPSSEGKFIDGGMVSNNPTLDLMSDISFWNSVCKYVDPESPYIVDLGCVVSVGTGVTPVSPVDPSLFEMSDMFGMLRGLRNLSLMVLDQATATEGAPIARSRSWCHSLGIPYFRLNAPLFKDIVLDSKEDPDLVKMMWDCVVYSFTHRKDFEELASLLKTIGPNKNRKKIALTLKAPTDFENGS